MTASSVFISDDMLYSNTSLTEACIEKIPASRAFVAIDQNGSLICEVSHTSDSLRVPRAEYESLLPDGEGHGSNAALWEKTFYDRDVIVARSRIAQMRTRHMYAALFQVFESAATRQGTGIISIPEPVNISVRRESAGSQPARSIRLRSCSRLLTDFTETVDRDFPQTIPSAAGK